MSDLTWSDFFKGIIAFIVLVCSILAFQWFSLDTNFLINFILAILSIAISIYFFVNSKTLLSEINLRIKSVERKFEGDTHQLEISDKSSINGEKQ